MTTPVEAKSSPPLYRGRSDLRGKLKKLLLLRASFANWVVPMSLVVLSMVASQQRFSVLATALSSKTTRLHIKSGVVLIVPILDVWPVVEVFALSEYDLPVVPWQDLRYVVDCGANAGSFSLWVTDRSECSLLAVEPNPAAFRLLQRNLASLGPRAKLLEAAVGGTSGECLLFDSGLTATASTKRLRKPARTFSVRGVTLDELLTGSGFPHVDLLKMDVEGAEQEALFAAGEQTYSKIRCAIIECHPFAGVDVAAIMQRLRQAGLKVESDGKKDLPLVVAWRSDHKW
jgi:FkbM family methyltransferase